MGGGRGRLPSTCGSRGSAGRRVASRLRFRRPGRVGRGRARGGRPALSAPGGDGRGRRRVKAVPVGHSHGQQILARMHDELYELAEEMAARPLDDAGGVCPAYEVLCYAQSSPIHSTVSDPEGRPEPFLRRHHDPPPQPSPTTARDGRGPGPAVRRAARRVFTLGVGGPVGSGKTALVERLCREFWPSPRPGGRHQRHLHPRGRRVPARRQVLPLERIVGVETGGCPHSAIREDASINLAADRRPGNGRSRAWRRSSSSRAATTWRRPSPRELADRTIYVIDVAEGDKIPRKGGPGITRSDLLVINKIDLAPHVGADLDVMRRDSLRMRGDRPFLLISLRTATASRNSCSGCVGNSHHARPTS